MKLIATLTIEITAESFLDAGKHQQRIDQIAVELGKDYDVTIDFREKPDRDPGGSVSGQPKPPVKII